MKLTLWQLFNEFSEVSEWNILCKDCYHKKSTLAPLPEGKQKHPSQKIAGRKILPIAQTNATFTLWISVQFCSSK